jgi:hypothetical protein
MIAFLSIFDMLFLRFCPDLVRAHWGEALREGPAPKVKCLHWGVPFREEPRPVRAAQPKQGGRIG